MHHSSPASHSEFSRPKLSVSYRRSRVSEIEFYHPLDAFLYLAGSFDLTRPLSEVEYYHPDKAVSHQSTHSSEFEYYRSVEAVLCHISRVSELGYYHPEEAGLSHSSPESYSERCYPKLVASYRSHPFCGGNRISNIPIPRSLLCTTARVYGSPAIRIVARGFAS